MVFNKVFFFFLMSEYPNHLKHQQTLIILKNQLNHQLKIVILKNLAHYEMFCEVFFSTNLFKGNF